MRSPALAMAWELWGKNRSGILACLFLLVVGYVPTAMLSASKVNDDWEPLVALVFLIQYLYLAAIATHPEFVFRNRRAGFSMGKFTLPVRTSALVAWHMLYACVGLIVVWMANYLVIWLPAKSEPVWWLLFPLAACLVWMQAICWSIPRSSLLQFLALCVTLPTIWTLFRHTAEPIASLYLFLTAILNLAPPPVLVQILTFGTFFIFAMAAAYVLAVAGVMRVRHGAGRPILWYPRFQFGARPLFANQATTSSPMVAQFWYELRRRRFLFLPLSAFGYLVFVTLVVGPFRNVIALLIAMVFTAFFVLVTALCVGYGMGKESFWGDLGISSWDATKPVSSGFIAIAKIRAAATLSLITWMFLCIAIPGWFLFMEGFLGSSLIWNPQYPAPFASMQIGAVVIGAVVQIAPILFPALVAITAGQIIGGLCASQTGRGWIVNGVALCSFGLVLAVGLSWRSYWDHVDGGANFWMFWTLVSSVLVGLKFVGAAWALRSGVRRGLVTFRQMTPYLALWCVGAIFLILALHFSLPEIWQATKLEYQSPGPVPKTLSALLAILALPLFRITAAPLAVAMSRHV